MFPSRPTSRRRQIVCCGSLVAEERPSKLASPRVGIQPESGRDVEGPVSGGRGLKSRADVCVKSLRALGEVESIDIAIVSRRIIDISPAKDHFSADLANVGHARLPEIIPAQHPVRCE